MYSISFTGHRPDKLPFFGEDDDLCIDLKARLYNQIKALAERGALEFYSGMALGVDTWAAEAVLEVKKEFPQISLNAVIPCPEQADRWSAEDKARYQKLLTQCSKKFTISPHYAKGCMMKRNKALVQFCDLLIAVFDGHSGGTMQTVNLARAVRKDIIIIPPIL